MIRETLAPGSRHVSLFATPRTERGIAFQRRRQTNGISVHTAGPAVAPPGWLTLGRVGDTISAYYRAVCRRRRGRWSDARRSPACRLQVFVGLAVSSHVDGTLATAVFDNVTVDQALLDASLDLGTVGVAGSTTFDGVVYEVTRRAPTSGERRTRSGSSITGRPRPGRARSPPGFAASRNTHAWAKAGVMFRQSPEMRNRRTSWSWSRPGRAWRCSTGPFTARRASGRRRAGIAPEWVRLTQVEGTVQGLCVRGWRDLAPDRRGHAGLDRRSPRSP